MYQSGMVAPPMGRRSFWIAVGAVAALHLWLLRDFRLPAYPGAPAANPAMHTRVLPQAAPPPAPVAAASPRSLPRAAQPATPRRKAAAAPRHPAANAATSARAPATGTHRDEHTAQEEAATLAEYEQWLVELAEERQHGRPEGAEPPPAATASAAAQKVGADAPNAAAAHGETAPSASAATPAPQQKIAPAPPPVVLPPSTTLGFHVSGHVKGFDYSARGQLLWQTDGATYQARQSISLLFLGSRAQQSQGRITAHGLQPERFVDEARRDRSVQLDFAAHQAQFSDGAAPTAAIGDGAQDRLSVFIQLGALIAAAPQNYPAGTKISFQTVGPRRVDTWTFLVQGLEVLALPAGDMATLKLQRLPQPDDDQTYELWLASSLHYLPVRIRLAQGKGDFVDLQLRSHESP